MNIIIFSCEGKTTAGIKLHVCFLQV